MTATVSPGAGGESGRAGAALGQEVEGVHEHEVEQGLLALDVCIDRPRRQAGGGRHVGHVSSLVAEATERPCGGIGDVCQPLGPERSGHLNSYKLNESVSQSLATQHPGSAAVFNGGDVAIHKLTR